jgi:DNA-binding transcriptional MocR family regulator
MRLDQLERPHSLAAVLPTGAAALLTVPRAQNPLGAALDAERAAELRALLAGFPDTLLVEDDHASAVAGTPFATSIASGWPRWAVVRSMSKILHPDMRLALVAGDETTIARVEGRQALGPPWVSHVLQGLVAEMLRDPLFHTVSERATDVYAQRREMLIGALAEQGIAAHGRSGMNVWVPVREETPVLRGLLDAGWLVLGGERFRIASAPGVRITISTLDEDDAAELARIIAGVEHAGTPRRMY